MMVKKLNYDDLEEGFDRNLVEIPEDKILRPNTKTKKNKCNGS